MEIENGAPIGKKLCDIVKIVLYMMRRSKAKRKIMVELNMLLKKGKNAGKAITTLILRHHHQNYAALTCRSADINTSFVSPREYEFSCSNTPLYPSKRKNLHHRHHHYHPEELKLAAPPELGAARKLRVSDSPEENDQLQVDKDAEEFIKKFYTELKKQKLYAAALESPSPYHEWAT